jgi:hypothetical protein
LVSVIGRFTFRLLLIGTATLAAQDACQPLNDAMLKVTNTPTHIYTTMTIGPNSGGKPQTIETIYAAGTLYTKVGGKWDRSTMTPAQVAKQEQENRRNSKTTCHYLKDEPSNGETAAVYGVNSETGGNKSAGQTWISKTRGLPLRQEFDIDIQGLHTKNHYSVRYEYSNVQAPQP